jgi:hypothetical protein
VCQVENEPRDSTNPDLRGDMISDSLAVAEETEPPPRWVLGEGTTVEIWLPATPTFTNGTVEPG